MLIWRLSKIKYATTAFDGEGARRAGGRWNSKGTAIVYCSATLSLTALETLVHLDVADFGTSRAAIRVEIPDDIERDRVEATQLIPDWRDTPAPSSLAVMGDQWAAQGKTLLLLVPSAVVPQENNILLNPRHADFAKIQIFLPEPFVLDARLLKQP
ncbi:MAG: RES family NAD+ phosphorylase [Gloeobacterales cyanobacterium]